MSMFKKNSSFIIFLTVLIDIFFIATAYLFSFWFRFYSGILDVTKGIPSLITYLFSLVFIVVIYIIIFNLLHLYKKEKIFEEYYTIFKSTLFVFFIFVTFTFLQREVSYSRIFIAVSFIFSFLFISFGRLLLNSLRSYLNRRGYLLTTALLICDPMYRKFFQEKITREHGYRLAHFLNPSSLKQLSQLLSTHVVDEIIMHLPKEDQSKILYIMEKGGHDISYKVVPSIVDIVTKRSLPEQIGPLSVLHIKETNLKGFNPVLKRLVDIFFSLFFILLSLPLFIVIAFLIKLTSKGFVFYKQERVSYNSKPFILYKFRTMMPDAEHQTGPKWADNHDSRIIPLGGFLRRTNLDELPQLFNVFLGHMSLVGPRPERPFFINQFKDKIPHYLERHAVKGGMTGWAQVNGYYGNTSLDERIKHDVFYIENWSLFFDIKILLLTIKLIFFKKH